MEIPEYVYKNLETFHNCSLPKRLIDTYGIEQLEDLLDCKIRYTKYHYNAHLQKETIFEYYYIAERGTKDEYL